MIEIGKLANREVVCIVTNMDEPLGYCIGNNLEVIEAVEFLKRKYARRYKRCCSWNWGIYDKTCWSKENIEENKKIM